MIDSKIVIFPHGQIDSDNFYRKLLFLGADIGRFWSAPGNQSDTDKFLAYFTRSGLARSPELSRAIVALTRSTSPDGIKKLRSKLTAMTPSLLQATWVIRADLTYDPFIYTNLQSFGKLQDYEQANPTVCLWTDPDAFTYLVMDESSSDFTLLSGKIERIRKINVRFWQKNGQSSTANRFELPENNNYLRPSSSATPRKPF